MAVNACLAPVCTMHGLAVTTVEGIGSTKTRLHPVQERIAKAHGSQCGFCTPGIVMSMYTLLRSMRKPSYSDLEVAFQGNLCRCTGYRAIVEGYKTFIEDWEKYRVPANGGACNMGDKCCKLNNKNCDNELDKSEVTFDSSEFIPYDASQEPIFPPELALSPQYNEQRLIFKGPNVTWHRPTTLDEVLQLKSQHNDAKLITGNTEVGVEVKFKNFLYPSIIIPSQVEEMTAINLTDNGLMIGASTTLTEMETAMKSILNCVPSYKTKIYKSIIDMLYWFAGKQIRNVAAVGGNIMTGSPISDLNPIFMASETVLYLKSLKGSRKVVMDKNFFTSYRKNIVLPEEVLVAIEIPFTKKNQYFKAFKQAKRREDDIAIVNIALNVEFEDQSSKISKINIAFGGMAPVTILGVETCKQITGLQWNDDLLSKVYSALLKELQLSPTAPGGMVKYRQSLTLSLFFKIYMEICEELQKNKTECPKVGARDKSAIGGFEHYKQKGSQYFHIPINSQAKCDPVGYPIPHVSAMKQATGEAVYCDDMPPIEGELYLALVLSTKACAKLVSIDPTNALSIPGVVDFFSAETLGGKKMLIGSIVHDEEVFVTENITNQGQVLGAIVAKDQYTAQKASKMVKVVYEELEPIITIEEAIRGKSYFPGYPKIITRGDVDKAFKEADHVFENDFRMGGQEHFYLETQACRVIPKKEDDEMEIFCSTQHPSEMSVSFNKI